MDKDDIKKKIENEEDYIRCPKCNNSLLKFLAKNSDGVENSAIARLLMVSEKEIEQMYEDAVKKLRAEMVDKDEG